VDIYTCITILKKCNSTVIIPEKDFLTDIIKKREISDNFILYLRIEENFLEKWNVYVEGLTELRDKRSTRKIHQANYKIYDNSRFLSTMKSPNYSFEFSTDNLIEKLDGIFSKFINLEDITNKNGIYCGTPRSKNYKLLKNALYDSKFQKNANDLKYIVSRNIFPFGIFWGMKINTINSVYHHPYILIEKAPFSTNLITKFIRIPKILIKANSRRISAAVDDVGYSFNGVYGINLKYNSASDFEQINFIDERIVTCILNSDLINYYVQKKFQSYMLRSRYLSINSRILRKIPIPIYVANKKHPSYPVGPQDRGSLITHFKQLRIISLKLTQNLNEIHRKLIGQGRDDGKLYKGILNDLKKSEFNTKNYAKISDSCDLKNFDRELFKYLENYQRNLSIMNEIVLSMFEIPDEIKNEVSKYGIKSET
jgi:hypothetical protein